MIAAGSVDHLGIEAGEVGECLVNIAAVGGSRLGFNGPIPVAPVR